MRRSNRITGLALGLAALSLVTVRGIRAHRVAPLLPLQGLVIEGEFFGPPNYGENPQTDAREHQLFLQLPATIATQRPTYKLADEIKDRDGYFIQIVALDDSLQKRARSLIGRRVQITGEPFAAETGHHRTGILLQVRTLEPIGDWKW